MLSTMQDDQLSLAHLLQYGARMHGDTEVATWTGSGSRRTTFGQVAKRAAQLAHALRELGVTDDQRVGTFMWNNAEHLECYLAVPAMGAVLHTLNIRLFPEQLTYVANHAEDHVVVVDGSLLPLFAKQLPEMKTVRHVIVANGDAAALEAPSGVTVHSYEELLAGRPETFDWPEIDERSAAAMCYTSGTTGDPKGVVYSHRSIWLHSMQICMTDMMRLTDSDRALVIVPMFHAMSWGMPYAAFMIGTSMVLPDRFLQPAPIAEILAAEKPTFAGAVPTIWQGLLQHLDANPQDISHLREVVVGGSAAPPAMMHAFEERYNVSVLHAWGMTETSPMGSVARPPSGATGEEAWRYRYTQGRFPALVKARLVDDEGNEVPWDGKSVGELEVKGPWITGSYYGGADPDKFHDGWLRTGDVGRITPDGYLTLTDRAKDVIKSGGEWISSVDLENAVMGHPAVAEAAVIGVPDEKWGERPLVAVVVREGEQVTAEELREFLRDKVAKWQLPENWTFVSEVPKTSVGKFDKKRLRAAHAEGKLDVAHL
ncbi:long-chain fatty acid--CoA ligase [Saccharomonospora glauca]|uniref:Acyl-CoA synthetase (AMP-forming)/AMP-acid ligase II n=1 Tax=Saccharomonospora glauca K62 TaxID=928724 RepID=I1D6J0_9PSEU|nr:long-chain fatty acid--CoA ligase [Saccharomonospora glauca]EIF00565.1 acyl-CoA synthetase (AMP-forming)/AMP-acid ligase II [Saccharomonospora glauca K62]